MLTHASRIVTVTVLFTAYVSSAKAVSCDYPYPDPFALTGVTVGISGGVGYFNADCGYKSQQEHTLVGDNGQYAYAAAKADLSTGKIGALAYVSASDYEFAGAQASAALHDEITFFRPSASNDPNDPDYWTSIWVSILIEGDFNSPSPVTSSFSYSLTSRATDGDGDRLVRSVEYSGIGGAQDGIDTQKIGDWSSDLIGPSTVRWYGTFDWGGKSVTADLFANFFLQAGVTTRQEWEQEYYTDFYNTASLDFILPPDVTFTSASGLFLSDASQIPEPPQLALLGIGLAGLGVARRKKSHQ